MKRRCWVNFQRRGVLLVWMIVGKGPIVLAVGAGGGCLDIFSSPQPKAPGELLVWEASVVRPHFQTTSPLKPLGKM